MTEYTAQSFAQAQAQANGVKAKFDLLWDATLAAFIGNALETNTFQGQGCIYRYAAAALQYRDDGMLDNAVHNLAGLCADTNNPSIACNVVYIARNYPLVAQDAIHNGLNALNSYSLGRIGKSELLLKVPAVIKPIVDWYLFNTKNSDRPGVMSSPEMAKGKLAKFGADLSRMLAAYSRAKETPRLSTNYTTKKVVYGVDEPQALKEWRAANAKPDPTKWAWVLSQEFNAQLEKRNFTVLRNVSPDEASFASGAVLIGGDPAWDRIFDQWQDAGIVQPLPKPVANAIASEAIALAIAYGQIANADILSDADIVKLNAARSTMDAASILVTLVAGKTTKASVRTPRTKTTKTKTATKKDVAETPSV